MTKDYRKGATRTNFLGRDRGLKGTSYGPAGPVRHVYSKHGTGGQAHPHHDDIWIVVGADRSPTGEREVHRFRTLKEAHEAGFTWAV